MSTNNLIAVFLRLNFNQTLEDGFVDGFVIVCDCVKWKRKCSILVEIILFCGVKNNQQGLLAFDKQ
jgi:hypothetical protein